jgi:uncharacterized membrane protein YsdA (DUF1294 family)
MQVYLLGGNYMDRYTSFLTLILVLNLISFSITGIDKYKSKHNRWRVSERTFFIIAAIGGSIGVLAGMYVFRHKTKHLSFKIGIPLILILQIVLICYWMVSWGRGYCHII